MEVKKSFSAGGKKYRPGDAPPEMDKSTQDHYLHHGMIGPKQAEKAKEVKAKETKPAGPKETK